MNLRITLIVLLCLCGTLRAEDDKPVNVSWSTNDLSGTKLMVPSADRISIIAFVRGEQEQSLQALEQIATATNAMKDAQVIVVFDGDSAPNHAKILADSKKYPTWPVVADLEFVSSGQLNVHVWPTTVIVDRAGKQIAHLAGLPKSFGSDLQAYLEHADGKLDQAALDKRLNDRAIVSESAQQVANVHLVMARKLLDAGQIDQARTQIDLGLKKDPADTGLKLALVRVMMLQHQPKEALSILDTIPPDAAPPCQIALLRTRGLIGLAQWDEARKIGPDTLKLNPNPAEAQYLQGLIFQHDGDAAHAMECFRKAFETTPAGQSAMIK